MRLLRTCAILALACALPRPVAGQDAATIAGRVLDAATGAPVEQALVTLEPATTGLVFGEPAAQLAPSRSLLTGNGGGYRFAGVTPGSYRVRVERLGYRAAVVDVEVRRGAGISFALDLDPVHLQPVRVTQRGASFFVPSAASHEEAAAARLAAERFRQELFLAPDVRVLTWGDVVDGVTLAEADVFRALQRVPGIGTRDDYSAELWTRGAPWPHTRVTFDGVPLFNPLHAVGVLSAVAPEALGAVFLHPGARPAAYGPGAAGVVDLRSRSGGGSGRVRGVADVSVASAKLSLDQHVAGRFAWAITARRSHLDVLDGGVRLLGIDSLDLPFVFHDVAARVDVTLTPALRLEASALHEQDRLFGDVPGVLERTTARWGNNAGRATLVATARGLEFSQSVGGSSFSVETTPHRVRGGARAWTEPAASNAMTHLQLSGELAPAGAGVSRWSVGYDAAWQGVDYDGPAPRTHAVRPDTILRVQYRRELRVLGVWADTRVQHGRFTVQPGLRIEHADYGAQPIAVAPRIAVRFAPSHAQSFSAAAGRSMQYAQALALAGPSVHPAFHASHFWLWADGTTPPLRADIASAGTERWLGGGWIVAANVYVRRTTGMMVPDPQPGPLGARPARVAAENRARGAELSARRIGAHWSLAAAYALAGSDIIAGGQRYPSAADRRHLADVTGTLRLPHGIRVGGAFTGMSGAPFTRAYSRSAADCQNFGFGCDNPTGSWAEDPNAERTPAYRSVDAVVQWTGRVRAVDVGAYVQVRNVFGRDNASTYSGSSPIARVQTDSGPRVTWDDRFERGLPRLPLLGLRVTF